MNSSTMEYRLVIRAVLVRTKNIKKKNKNNAVFYI